jgi:hypothetical protein
VPRLAERQIFSARGVFWMAHVGRVRGMFPLH